MTRIMVEVIDRCAPANCTACQALRDEAMQSTYFFCRKTSRLIEVWNFKADDKFPDFCPLQKG